MISISPAIFFIVLGVLTFVETSFLVMRNIGVKAFFAKARIWMPVAFFGAVIFYGARALLVLLVFSWGCWPAILSSDISAKEQASCIAITVILFALLYHVGFEILGGFISIFSKQNNADDSGVDIEVTKS